MVNFSEKSNSENESVKLSTRKHKIKTGLVGVAMLGSTFQGLSNTNPEGVDDGKNINIPEKTISIDETTENSNDYIVNPDDTNVVDEHGDDDKKKENSAEKKESAQEFSLDITNNFELASAEIKDVDVESMKLTLKNFMDSLPAEIIKRIKNGETAITVFASCSSEAVQSSYTTAGRKIKNNQELAYARADETIKKVIKGVLSELGLDESQVEIHIPLSDGDREAGVAVDGVRRVEIIIIDTLEKEDIVSSRTGWIMLDNSGSMFARTQQVRRDIGVLNENNEQEIETIQLQGGSGESHLRTLTSFFLRAESQNNSGETRTLHILTDELDSTRPGVKSLNPETYNEAVKKYKAEMQKALEIAEERNIEIIIDFYNPDPKKSDFKQIPLTMDNPLLIMDRPGNVSRKYIYKTLDDGGVSSAYNDGASVIINIGKGGSNENIQFNDPEILKDMNTEDQDLEQVA